MRKSIMAATLVAILSQDPAYSQFGLGATEVTQLLNHGQLAMQYSARLSN
jgi:hypothetical protein